MSSLIIANWKMNMTSKDVATFMKSFKNPAPRYAEVVICAPFPFIGNISNGAVRGAQDVSQLPSGAYTGEVSAQALKDLGVQYCLVGHSERRIYLEESDELIAKKIKQLHAQMITPVLCVGETAEERAKGKTFTVLQRQLKKALTLKVPSLIIAYEPVWAISTFQKTKKKVSATSSDIDKVHTYIKRFAKKYGYKNMQVLYGGSVSEKNALEVFSVPSVDGALVGGASMQPVSFASIINTLRHV